MPTKSEEIPLLERNSNLIIIDNRMFLSTARFMKARFAMHIATENIAPDYISQVLPKGSLLLAPFNMLIRRMQNMGLINQWIAKTYRRLSPRNAAIYPRFGDANTLYENPTKANERRSSLKCCKEKNLCLSDLRSIFFVWLILIFASILVFACEILQQWINFSNFVHKMFNCQ